ncbi:MAG: hypothetical protein ACOCWZ_09020, partial [Spirochaetota bacterium]
AALSDTFNEFDLYIMGLMDYEEASRAVHYVYEHEQEDKIHAVTLDDIIYALGLTVADHGDLYFTGDGKRMPPLEPANTSFNILVVVVKGQDETIEDTHMRKLLYIADGLPTGWKRATWDFSTMSTGVDWQ